MSDIWALLVKACAPHNGMIHARSKALNVGIHYIYIVHETQTTYYKTRPHLINADRMQTYWLTDD